MTGFKPATLSPTRPLTPEHVAERWGCSANHVRQLIKAGELRAFRVGRLFRIRPEAVEEFELRPSRLNE